MKSMLFTCYCFYTFQKVKIAFLHNSVTLATDACHLEIIYFAQVDQRNKTSQSSDQFALFTFFNDSDNLCFFMSLQFSFYPTSGGTFPRIGQFSIAILCNKVFIILQFTSNGCMIKLYALLYGPHLMLLILQIIHHSTTILAQQQLKIQYSIPLKAPPVLVCTQNTALRDMF